MRTVYISLGSNLGDRRRNIERAVADTGRIGRTRVKRRSRVYESEPLGGPPQGKFLNGVIRVETDLKPDVLLARLSEIEDRLGRERGIRNGPRTIDLDILFYGGLVVRNKRLTVPHPRLHERDFVLKPLKELAPSLRHPVLGRTVSEMAKRRRMIVLGDPAKVRRHISRLRRKGGTAGFVPTMGYLHEGHLSLIRRARRECDVVAVSIFVNPAQFGPGEDYNRYPRDIKRDEAMCRGVGTDILFYPGAGSMYPEGFATGVSVKGLTDGLCGPFRPGHFTGVATVVAKLLNIVGPDIAYFGRKDGQQAIVIKRMAADLSIPVDIRICPTVREPDGLAMSSRNVYLNSRQRREAPALYGSLVMARKMIKGGERNPDKVTAAMRKFISSRARAVIDYISIVDTSELKDVGKIRGEVMVALAARFGRTRLIDNIFVKV